MSPGRVLSSCAASVAVAGCAVLALAMSSTGGAPDKADAAHTSPTHTSSTRASHTHASHTQHESTRTAVLLPGSPAATSASTSARPHTPPTSNPADTPTVPARTGTPVTSTHVPAPSTAAAHPQRRVVTHTGQRTTEHTRTPPKPKSKPVTHRNSKPRATHGVALPLHYGTGSATRVLTVLAHSTGSTTARLQAWARAPGGGWLRHGSAVTAHIGSDGMTPHPSEYRSATPMGSFTLTQAFGRQSDPGTALPYFKTTPADWWISQAGPLYNTHQRCSSCGYRSPDEHLYYETPYYNYAVVIDTPHGRSAYPHGSAFFLHVYPPGTGATAGCVAIPQSKLVSLMRWLRPAAHPRILIGT